MYTYTEQYVDRIHSLQVNLHAFIAYGCIDIDPDCFLGADKTSIEDTATDIVCSS